MSIGKRLKALRVERDLTQDQVAKYIETTKQAIYKYETGIVTNIPTDKIERLAELFGVPPSYLLGWSRDGEDATASPILPAPVAAQLRPVRHRRFPVLGNVACGEPTFADEQRGTFVDASSDVDADFCLIANGDSMINARIFQGDLLFVKSQEIVDDGEIAVVLIGDETTVKRVYYDRENNTLTLMPENPTHKPMRFSGAALADIRILGKVTAVQFSL